MKSVLIHLEDKEYERLTKTKGKATWKSFMDDVANKKQIIEKIKEFDIEQVKKITECEDKEFYELIEQLTK